MLTVRDNDTRGNTNPSSRSKYGSENQHVRETHNSIHDPQIDSCNYRAPKAFKQTHIYVKTKADFDLNTNLFTALPQTIHIQRAIQDIHGLPNDVPYKLLTQIHD